MYAVIIDKTIDRTPREKIANKILEQMSKMHLLGATVELIDEASSAKMILDFVKNNKDNHSTFVILGDDYSLDISLNVILSEDINIITSFIPINRNSRYGKKMGIKDFWEGLQISIERRIKTIPCMQLNGFYGLIDLDLILSDDKSEDDNLSINNESFSISGKFTNLNIKRGLGQYKYIITGENKHYANKYLLWDDNKFINLHLPTNDFTILPAKDHSLYFANSSTHQEIIKPAENKDISMIVPKNFEL